MGVDDLAVTNIVDFQNGGDFMPDKIMQPRYTDAGLSAMFIFVIITYFVKIIPVIKYADSDQIV
jgi:hypothetical protein